MGDPMAGLSSAQASTLLDVSARALGARQEELQPADMLALLQLLSVAADTPTEPLRTNQSQRDLREMSQNFISVADSLISEGSASKWQDIKEVAAARGRGGKQQRWGFGSHGGSYGYGDTPQQLAQLGDNRGQCAAVHQQRRRRKPFDLPHIKANSAGDSAASVSASLSFS